MAVSIIRFHDPLERPRSTFVTCHSQTSCCISARCTSNKGSIQYRRGSSGLNVRISTGPVRKSQHDWHARAFYKAKEGEVQ